MAAVRESDIVVTAPGYTGMNTREEILENQHNSELAHRLEGSPGFWVRSVSGWDGSNRQRWTSL